MNKNAGNIAGAGFWKLASAGVYGPIKKEPCICESAHKNVFAYDDIVDGNFFALTGSKQKISKKLEYRHRETR